MPLGIFFLISLIKVIIALIVLLTLVAYIQLAERKLVARIQNRIGPNRVGPRGFLQPAADAIKFILKEDITPTDAHPFLYLLAPAISVVLALTALAVVPIGGTFHWFGYPTQFQVANINVGLLFILGVTSLGVY
ncbi:MAG: NADH-quinone oxidoreductase subunit H, partial [Terriglobales bacterium]